MFPNRQFCRIRMELFQKAVFFNKHVLNHEKYVIENKNIAGLLRKRAVKKKHGCNTSDKNIFQSERLYN